VGAMAPPTPSTLKEKKIIKVKRKKKKEQRKKKKKVFFDLLAYRKNFFWLLGHSLLSSPLIFHG
jgi:hypothetical protein